MLSNVVRKREGRRPGSVPRSLPLILTDERLFLPHVDAVLAELAKRGQREVQRW